MSEPRFDLGDRVTFTEHFVRVATPIPPEPGNRWWEDNRTRKTWNRRPVRPYSTPAHQVGVIVGARTVYDGVARYGFEDNPTTFTREDSHQAYVIATSLRGRHVLVPFDAVAASEEA